MTTEYKILSQKTDNTLILYKTPSNKNTVLSKFKCKNISNEDKTFSMGLIPSNELQNVDISLISNLNITSILTANGLSRDEFEYNNTTSLYIEGKGAFFTCRDSSGYHRLIKLKENSDKTFTYDESFGILNTNAAANAYSLFYSKNNNLIYWASWSNGTERYFTVNPDTGSLTSLATLSHTANNVISSISNDVLDRVFTVSPQSQRTSSTTSILSRTFSMINTVSSTRFDITLSTTIPQDLSLINMYGDENSLYFFVSYQGTSSQNATLTIRNSSGTSLSTKTVDLFSTTILKVDYVLNSNGDFASVSFDDSYVSELDLLMLVSYPLGPFARSYALGTLTTLTSGAITNQNIRIENSIYSFMRPSDEQNKLYMIEYSYPSFEILEKVEIDPTSNNDNLYTSSQLNFKNYALSLNILYPDYRQGYVIADYKSKSLISRKETTSESILSQNNFKHGSYHGSKNYKTLSNSNNNKDYNFIIFSRGDQNTGDIFGVLISLDIPEKHYIIKNKEVSFDEEINIDGGIALSSGDIIFTEQNFSDDFIIQAYGLEETI